MADDGGASAKTGLAALAEITEQIRKIVDSPAEAAEEASSAPTGGGSDAAAITELATSVRRAAEGYKKTMRWLVSAVAFVGVVLFGSGPFLLDDALADPLSRSNIAALIGLACVAIGIVFVVVSATRVYEPEDASLGELADSFRELEGNGIIGPRKDALERLKRILTGDEASAHLGPHCQSVKHLVLKLKELEEANLEHQGVLEAATRAVEGPTARLRDLRQQLESTLAALAKARDRVITPDEQGAADVAAQRRQDLHRLSQEEVRIRTEVAGAERVLAERHRTLEFAQVQIAPLDFKLQTYSFHRQIVLNEALVTQMRGTFRAARRWLVAGATFTLLGGVIVLGRAQVDGKLGASTTPARSLLIPAVVEVKKAAKSAASLPDDCRDIGLTARFGSLILPEPGSGFTVTVLAPPACAGVLTIPAEDTEKGLVVLTVPTPS